MKTFILALILFSILLICIFIILSRMAENPLVRLGFLALRFYKAKSFK